jgi:hypothetical protein
MVGLILLPFTLLRITIALLIVGARLMFWMIVVTFKLTVGFFALSAKLLVFLVAVLVKVTPLIVAATLTILAWTAAVCAVLVYNAYKLLAAPVFGSPIQAYLMATNAGRPNFHFRPSTWAIPTRKRTPAITNKS